MAIPAVTTAALLSAPLVVLLIVFGHMATSAPTDLSLEGCTSYKDIQTKLTTVNCTSFRPVLTAASSLMSDFSHIDVLNVQDVVDGSSDYIIDGLFGVFSNVKYMNLINASISKIDPNAFKGLKLLEELDLSKNRIFKFRPESFSETPKLRLIDLSYNPIRLGPTTFLYSKSLEDLIISSCNLTSVPAGSFRGLPNLKTLDLYDNQIKSFTVRSFPRNLRQLLLTKNNLTNIPTKALSSLRKLNRLDISENPINCTCSLVGLQDEFSSKGVLFENDVVCRYPSEYEGESWRKVSENEVCFHVEETTLISNENTSENSCENEICDETNDEDRYTYAIQADQAPNEDSSSGTTISPDDHDDEKNTISQMFEDKVAVPTINHENISTTEENNSNENSDTDKSKKLIEDSTTISAVDSQEVTPETLSDTQADSSNSPISETLIDSTLTTESSQLIDLDKISSTGETVDILDSAPSSSSLKDSTTLPPEIQLGLNSQVPETITLNSDLSNSPIELTTVSVITGTESATLLSEQKISTDATNNDDFTTVTPPPTSSVQTTPPNQPTSLELSEASTESHTEGTTTVMGGADTTTSLPIITTPAKVSDDDQTFPVISEITTPFSTNIAVTETSTVSEFIQSSGENKELIIETTTPTSSVETTTLPIVSISTTEKTNYFPHSKEDTVEEASTTVKPLNVGQEVFVEPTNKTEAIVVLPSTDNREGKMLESNRSEEQKPEAMGSYIVLAGIIIVLLLLILYATTRKSKKQTKKPFMDTENNMTELQDMTTLLPSSPVVTINGSKNNKYPNEEPSVTTKLLETEDQPDIPDSNGNGYTYPDDNKPDKTKEIDNMKEPNRKSTLPRTNGSNGAPPLELTKAKVLVLHDSLPRTPIYIQKNVNS